MKTRKAAPRTKRRWMVYTWAPVNVRVCAGTAKEAAALALEALNKTCPLELSNSDSASYNGMYIDYGYAAKLDRKHSPNKLDDSDACDVINPEAEAAP